MHQRPRLRGLIVALLLPAAWTVARADEPPLEKTNVFVRGQGGYFAYRIPALITSPRGTLLVFCEGRKTSLSDDGDIDMLLRRSTDGGRTWLPTQLVYEEGGEAPIKFGNPCPVVEQESGVIFLLMNRSTGATLRERAGGEIFIMESKDDGQTWSQPRNITSQVKKPDWGAYALGPGVGIQITQGPHQGRLVVPANYRESFNQRDPSFSHVIYSDDRGQTWHLGGVLGRFTNECQVAEILEDGKPGLLIDMRNHWGRGGVPEKSGRRLHARSFDGGMTWTAEAMHPALIDPPCQASLFRYSWKTRDSESVLLCANPAANSRSNLTVRASFDQGHTWPASLVVEPGAAAYSCLTRLANGRIGLVYEGDSYGRLTFTSFALEAVRANER